MRAAPVPQHCHSLPTPAFRQGVFHVEGKYTSRCPRLIEVNFRMVIPPPPPPPPPPAVPTPLLAHPNSYAGERLDSGINALLL